MVPGSGDADDQRQLWNGPAGRAWVDTQDTLDRMFEPFEHLLVEAVSAGGSRQVIDVGCGTGATTIALARAVGPSGLCTGVDLSEPMTGAARARASREGVSATFVCADAQNYAFPPRRAEAIVSRFGVMFFDDPTRAFANLRAAAVPGARMTVLAWRSPSDNPFMTTAERAAAPLLPAVPPRQPGAPASSHLPTPDASGSSSPPAAGAGSRSRPSTLRACCRNQSCCRISRASVRSGASCRTSASRFGARS